MRSRTSRVGKSPLKLVVGTFMSFSEGDCTILLAQTATVHTSPDLLSSVAAFTIIVYAKYSYAQK